jgi:urease accessory protein UreF
VGVQQQLAKETKLIAALKQHYERYHADDLAALKKLYEYHAENCVRAAELTDERRRRGEYLKLAREWTEAAAALQAWTDRIMARGSNQAKQADDAASHTSRPRRRRATRNPHKGRKRSSR